MKSLVKQFDLFSKPFVFFVGDKKNKSTFIGGSLSLSIILISIVYFYYLISLYLTNKVEPKITSSISIENDRIEINIDESFFIFEMLIQGEPLKQYEKRVGKNFLTYTVYYETFASNGVCTAIEVPYSECQDSKFKGFQCVDKDAIQGKNIFLQPINKISSDFALAVHFCDPLKELNCATQEEINETILQSSNYFQVYTKIRQYNPSLRSYKDGYKAEYFFFDLNSVVYTRISLIKATTTVTEGFLIQASESNNAIFDFKRVDTYFSREKIYERMGIDGFAYIVFEINQVRNIIVVQHAMITEVLAQFMSIFNSLLTIGILARLLAESHIVEDMNCILLKEYYKKTALKLVDKREKRKQQQQQQPLETIQNEPYLKTDSIDRSHAIAQMQKKINDTNFAEESRSYFEMSYLQRFKIFISQLIGKHPTIDLKDQVTTDSQIYQRLLSQSVKRINIFEVYKDLIKMKMSIKLMLTKEQYAAMQFCGSEIFPEEYQRKPEIQLLPPDNSSMNLAVSEAKNCQPNSPENSKQAFISPTGNRFSSGQNAFKDSINNMSPMLEAQSQDYQDKQSAPLSIKNNEILNNYQNESFYQLYPQLKRESNINEEQLLDQQSNLSERQNFQHKSRSSLGKMFSKLNKSSISKNEGDNIELEDSQIAKENMSNTERQADFQNQQKKKEKSCITTQKDNCEEQLQIHQQLKNDITPKEKAFRYFEGFLHQHKSHLYEMDSIEENEDLQEELLNTFLHQIRWKIGEEQDLKRLTQVDRQIYLSLIAEEGQIPGIKYEKKDHQEGNQNNSHYQKNEKNQDIEEINSHFHKINNLDQEQQSGLNPQKVQSIDQVIKNNQIIEEKQTANSFKTQNSQDKHPVDSNLQYSIQMEDKYKDSIGKQEHKLEKLIEFN